VKLRLVRTSPDDTAPPLRAEAPEPPPSRESAHAIQSAIEAAIANSSLVPTAPATTPLAPSIEAAQSAAMGSSPVPPPVESSPLPRRAKEHLVVPQYCVNMSMDIKFEADPDQVRANISPKRYILPYHLACRKLGNYRFDLLTYHAQWCLRDCIHLTSKDF